MGAVRGDEFAELCSIVLGTEIFVAGDIGTLVRRFAGGMSFTPVVGAGGVRLDRSGISSGKVLVDDPNRNLRDLLADTMEWCAREALDVMSDSVRLVVAALASEALPAWRRWRVAFLLASAAELQTRLGLAEEDAVARAHAPRITRLHWHLLRVAVLDPELRRTAESLHPLPLDAAVRATRTAWVDYLLHYEDHPLIAGIEPEREARRLLDVDLRTLSPESRRPLDPIDRGERAFRSLLARELFARRFDLRGLWGTLPADRLTRGLAWTVTFLLALVPVSVLIAAMLTDWQTLATTMSRPVRMLLWSGLVAGLTSYVVLLCAIPVRSERLTYPFLLRFAASVLVGTGFVVSLGQPWLQPIAKQAPPGWAAILTSGGAAAVAYGYLLVEARLHGSHGWQAVRRAAAVALIGVAHALVAALLLVMAAEALGFVTVGTVGDVGRMRATSVVATVALAAGVFLQILWEDRPVTYPLGVFRYRR